MNLSEKIANKWALDDGDLLHNAAVVAMKEYAKIISIAYVRWIEENRYMLWNEEEWYSDYDELIHLTDDELFEKFLEEYETK